jgi:hypothetical protein
MMYSLKGQIEDVQEFFFPRPPVGISVFPLILWILHGCKRKIYILHQLSEEMLYSPGMES